MGADDIILKGTICCSKLNKRIGKPSLNAERAGFFHRGNELEILDVVVGETEEDYYEGIPTWYKANGGIFVWSGGVTIHHDSDIYKRKLNLDQTYGSESELTGKIDFQKYIDDSFVGGQSIRTINYNNYLNVDKGLKDTQGAQVIVGVLDHPIKKTHPGFDNSVVKYKNLDIEPASDHGSFMAGLIGGKSKIKGIVPQSIIWELPIYNENGNPNMEWLIDELDHLNMIKDKLVVLNVSQKFRKLDSSVLKKFNILNKHPNVIIVAAAGTDQDLENNILQYPVSLSNTISVGSITKEYWKSNQNPKFNNVLDVLVPEFVYLSFSNDDNMEVRKDSGDSCACAIVSGVIALLVASGEIDSADPNKIRKAINKQSQSYHSSSIFSSLNLINPMK